MSDRTSVHPLDEALVLEDVAADTFRGHIPPAWANMVGPFGGSSSPWW